ncbi:MAG: hypothetical protein HRF45_12765 [Fimbriimonadia bacterium]|jgi:hypothetical protein
MSRLTRLWSAVGLLTIAALAGAQTGEVERVKPEVERDSVMREIGRLVGGSWVTDAKDDGGKPIATLRYEWSADKKLLLGKGTIMGAAVDVRVGWDPAAKKVYYLDSHGPETVFFGYFTLEEGKLVARFKMLVGGSGEFEARGSFTDDDTYENTMSQIVDGRPGASRSIALHRVK